MGSSGTVKAPGITHTHTHIYYSKTEVFVNTYCTVYMQTEDLEKYRDFNPSCFPFFKEGFTVNDKMMIPNI